MELQNPNMKTISSEVKKVWGLRIAGAGVGIGALALSSQYIWSAVTGGAGLIVGGVIAAIGVGLFQMLPLAGQKWENKIMAMRKAEARANPIEQYENYLLEKRANVDLLKDAVTEIGAQIKSMINMVAEQKAKKPKYDSSQEEADIASMQAAYKELAESYQAAEEALTDLKERIDDRRFKHNFGKVGQKAITSLSAANGQTSEQMVGAMLIDEADNAVLDNYNRVFAALDLHASRLKRAKSLNHETGLVIDMSTAPIPVKQNVRSE